VERAGDITYLNTGSGGTPIVCLHGIGGNVESFRPQLDHIGNFNRIIAWNMPGYGGSKRLEQTSFTTLAAALASFLDALDIDKVHLIGQSIGGMIAQEFAITHSDRVENLVLIATTPSFGGRDEQFRENFLKARLKPLDDGLTLADLAVKFVPEIVGSAASPEAIRSATQSMAAVPADSYRDTIECLVTFNRRAELADIAARTCLIAGSEDKNAPARTMKKMAERMSEKLPRAEFHEIEGAGHLINLEVPEICNEIIMNFLGIAEQKTEKSNHD